MSISEKTKIVRTLTGEGSDDELVTYLQLAKSAILNRMYPFGNCPCEDVPLKYAMLQCQLAARYYLRRGGEGELIHNENGINRTYGTVNDEDLLMEVMQVIR